MRRFRSTRPVDGDGSDVSVESAAVRLTDGSVLFSTSGAKLVEEIFVDVKRNAFVL